MALNHSVSLLNEQLLSLNFLEILQGFPHFFNFLASFTREHTFRTLPALTWSLVDKVIGEGWLVVLEGTYLCMHLSFLRDQFWIRLNFLVIVKGVLWVVD